MNTGKRVGNRVPPGSGNPVGAGVVGSGVSSVGNGDGCFVVGNADGYRVGKRLGLGAVGAVGNRVGYFENGNFVGGLEGNLS